MTDDKPATNVYWQNDLKHPHDFSFKDFVTLFHRCTNKQSQLKLMRQPGKATLQRLIAQQETKERPQAMLPRDNQKEKPTMTPTLKPVTWDELATLYDAAGHSRPARTLPMDTVLDWAERHPDQFFVNADGELFHMIPTKEAP